MRPTLLLIAALGAAAPLGSALADGMIEDGFQGGDRQRSLSASGRHGAERRERTRHYGARRRHGYGRAYGGELSPHYGAHPPFYPGAGHAAPHGPVGLAEYSEPYIGRGLIYNVPPDPFLRSGFVVRAKG